MGVLIKGPEVLESTRKVDTVVLDKTGTVTTGKMTLVDVVVEPRRSTATELLRLAGALEDASEHPIAQAIAKGAAQEVGALPTPEDFANVEGKGVQGIVDGHAVLVGPRVAARRLVPAPRAPISPRAKAHAEARGQDRRRRRLGRPGARRPRGGRHGQADQRRGHRPAAGPRSDPGPAHR